MSKPDLRYETAKKELLAIVNGLKQYRQCLARRHFIIRTDHAALSWLGRTPEPMPQLARWLNFIEKFDYEAVHRDGKRHTNANGLRSRAEPLAMSDERAIRTASKIASSEQLNVVYSETDTKQDEVTDSEQSELEDQTKTEVEPSVRESLAARQQSDPELGKLVRLRL